MLEISKEQGTKYSLKNTSKLGAHTPWLSQIQKSGRRYIK